MMQPDETTAAEPGAEPNAAPDDPRLTQLLRRLEERDETIRLLNEALSAALDELEGTSALAA